MYGRLSDNPGGRKVSVARQIADGLALVERNGWTVVGEYGDDGISALRGKHRPGYSAIMEAALDGEVDKIVCYQTSRIWRNRRERAAALEILGKAGVSIEAVQGPSLDLSTAGGRMLAGLLGEFDTMESEVKSERVMVVAAERAAKGKASAHVLYGWRRVVTMDDRGKRAEWHDEVEPVAAAVVKWIVDQLLAKVSMNKITESLNERAVPTPREALVNGTAADGTGSRLWRTSTVRKLAMRPANVARRVHHRVDSGPAAWEPIIEQDKHDRVMAMLSDPTRTKTKDGLRANLLSFSTWASCGVCGSYLRVAPGAKGVRAYICDTSQGCVGRNKDKVEALVAAHVQEYVADPANRPTIIGKDKSELSVGLDLVKTLEARRDLAADSYATGEIDMVQLTRINEHLRPEIEQAKKAIRSRSRRVQVGDVLALTSESWLSMSVLAQRAVLEDLGVQVKIMPTKRGPIFRPEDVHVTIGHDGAE